MVPLVIASARSTDIPSHRPKLILFGQIKCEFGQAPGTRFLGKPWVCGQIRHSHAATNQDRPRTIQALSCGSMQMCGNTFDLWDPVIRTTWKSDFLAYGGAECA